MPDPFATTPPPIPTKPAPRPTRAYTTLFWFLIVGQILATFTALMAIATLLATARPVVQWRVLIPVVTEMTSWQTYQHPTDCYSVQYPQNYHVSLQDNLLNFNFDPYTYQGRGLPAGGVKIQFQRHDLPASKSSFSFVKSRNLELPSEFETEIMPVELGAFRYTNKTLKGPGDAFDAFYAPVDFMGQYYQALVWGSENDADTVKAILATFAPASCAGVADTSGWKTYQNESLGITFQYPSAWQVLSPDVYKNDREGQPTGVLWTMQFGVLQPGACEGSDCYPYTLEGRAYEAPANVAAALGERVRQDRTLYEYRIIIYADDGICGYRVADVFGQSTRVQLSEMCGYDRATPDALDQTWGDDDFEQLLQSMRFIK